MEWIKGLVEYVFPDILGEDRENVLKIIEKKEMEDLVERIKNYEEMREKRLIVRINKNNKKVFIKKLADRRYKNLKNKKNKKKIKFYKKVLCKKKCYVRI